MKLQDKKKILAFETGRRGEKQVLDEDSKIRMQLQYSTATPEVRIQWKMSLKLIGKTVSKLELYT